MIKGQQLLMDFYYLLSNDALNINAVEEKTRGYLDIKRYFSWSIDKCLKFKNFFLTHAT